MTQGVTSFGQADLSTCDKEQIHIPGSIQPHGVLLGLHPKTSIIEVVSANVSQFFEEPPSKILGRSLSEVLMESSYAEARRIFSIPDMIGRQNVNLKPSIGTELIYEGLLHHSSGLDILELEPHDHVAENFFLRFYEQYLHELYDLQKARDADELFTLVCRLIKKMTGFERVWLYQFDRDWNGEIVAEEKEPHLPTFLGLHYPASDIPQQARALYIINRLRLIVDVNAAPVPLIPEVNPVDGAPIDLSISVLRAISPIHIEYMQNMGVTASMTISLIWNNELSGLISCHDHRGPRFVPYEMRKACEFLGFTVSHLLAEIKNREKIRVYRRTQKKLEKINQQLKDEVALFGVLLHGSPNLLDLIPAQGAAIVRSGEIFTVGKTPNREDIFQLLNWLQQSEISELFLTDQLGKHFPAAASWSDKAAGILAFNLSPKNDDWALWFRGEVVHTVEWGGDPDKLMTQDPQTGRIHPRKSFAKWKEIVKGCSLPWDDDEVDSIRPFWSDLMRFMRLLDLEKQNRINRHLQQAQKMEAVGTLAGGIAHDFNNILGAILGYAEMVQDDCPPGSTMRNDIDRVVEAGHRAKELVKQILAFSRQTEYDEQVLQPASIIKEAIKMLRASIPTTIDIQQDIALETGLILADPTQIHQILTNLCTNASHAMEEAGGTLNISLKNKEFTSDDLVSEPHVQPGLFVEISVGDTGPGISPQIISKIFDPFFTTKEVGKGTGMGLAIIHGIAKKSGGFVSCKSSPDEGTIFHIYLPVHEATTLPAGVITPVELIETGIEHILFIDDEEMLAEMGKAMLERLGYRVTVKTSSLEALKIIQDQPDSFDLVITDQTMPGMTGNDLARRILQIRPDLPIILCTGFSNQISEEKARIYGIKGFAMKPLSKKDLASLIRKVLDGE